MMYQLMVKRNFVAQHYLTVPDCGPENEWHSHTFAVEVLLQGQQLNEHGYLVDIVEVKTGIDGLVRRFQDKTMNDQPEFEGLNPSIEHFARIFCTGLLSKMDTAKIDSITVRMWEDDEAWASYTHTT